MRKLLEYSGTIIDGMKVVKMSIIITSWNAPSRPPISETFWEASDYGTERVEFTRTPRSGNVLVGMRMTDYPILTLIFSLEYDFLGI